MRFHSRVCVFTLCTEDEFCAPRAWVPCTADEFCAQRTSSVHLWSDEFRAQQTSSVHRGRVLCTAGVGSVHSGRVLCTADEFCAPRAWVPCTATPSPEGSPTRAVAVAVCWIALPDIRSTTREHGARTTLPPSRRTRSCVGAREGALMGEGLKKKK